MNTVVRDYLIEAAHKHGIVYYQDLCNACNLKLDMHNNPADRGIIGSILGEISRYEYENKRPLLSAIVLSKSGEEGDGFYKMCEQFGITGDWRKLKREETFAVAEIKKCHEFWSNPVKYKENK